MRTPITKAHQPERETASTATVHEPRPPRRAKGENGWQCRFGCAEDGFSALSRIDDEHSVRVIVFRDSERQDFGRLEISMSAPRYGSSSVQLNLTGEEMETLANALLDAAHHFRTVPATKFVAPAKSELEEVAA